MKKLLKKRSKKVGAPPGSLIYTGDSKTVAPTISVFLYDADSLEEKHPQTISEALAFCKNGKKVWINVNGIHDPLLIHSIGQHFQLHPLLLEDIMNPAQRSKLDDYKSYIYIAVHNLYMNVDHLEEEQISLVIGDNVLLSFCERQTDAFKPILERFLKPSTRMRQRKADYLAYTILDCIVDNYFLILEKVDERLEALESALLRGENSTIMFRIQAQKRELMILRKAIWPMREVINHFRRIDSPLVSETTRLYIYDVYDHAIQSIEAVETFRDLVSGMHDIHLASINQKMNETMKVLTIVATIFVPLSFITGIYGMNFDIMPELHHPLGYPIVLLGMTLIALIMLIAFRKNKWI